MINLIPGFFYFKSELNLNAQEIKAYKITFATNFIYNINIYKQKYFESNTNLTENDKQKYFESNTNLTENDTPINNAISTSEFYKHFVNIKTEGP